MGLMCHFSYGERHRTRPGWERTVSGPVRRQLESLGRALLILGITSCAGRPAAVDAAPEATAPVKSMSQWTYASDSQRIHAIAASAETVWAASQDGLLRWERPKGAVSYPSGEDVPTGPMNALAVAGDGTLYVGTPGGLIWRDAKGKWSRLSHPVVTKGVTALAPRRAGGAWVGLSPGLAWIQGNRLQVVSTSHRVNAIAVGPSGRVWVATAGHGLITVLGDRIIEHTTGQGVCGNRVRAVGIGPGGRVAAVCGGPKRAVALLEGGRWYPFSVEDVGQPLQMNWVGRSWVLRTDEGWRRLEYAPPPPPPTKGAITEAVTDLTPIGPGILPPAPSPPVMPRSAAKAPGGGSTKPPPVAMPAPIATSTAPTVVLDELLTRIRAPVSIRGRSIDAPRYRFTDFEPLIPEDASVTYWGPDATGTSWFGVAHQGVLAQRGAARERYVSLDLVPRHEELRLVVNAAGQALIPSLEPYLYVGTPQGGWARKEVGVGSPDREVVAVARDPDAGVWVAVAYPERVVEQVAPSDDGDEAQPGSTPPALGFVRLVDGEPDFPYPTQVLSALAGPLRMGVLKVSSPGEALAALYWQHPRGGLGTAGLAWIDPRGRSIERIGPDFPKVANRPNLPDGRVTDLATGPDGTLYLGTRSGLVRTRDGQTRVFDENDFMDSESVNCLGVDALGRVWVGTDEGLGLVQGDAWRPIRHRLLDGVAINALTFEPGGEIWLGTAQGLIRGDGQRFMSVLGRRKRPLRNVRSLAWDGKGGLWVLTDQGVWHRGTR